jgi:hypothetical protein
MVAVPLGTGGWFLSGTQSSEGGRVEEPLKIPKNTEYWWPQDSQICLDVSVATLTMRSTSIGWIPPFLLVCLLGTLPDVEKRKSS